LIQIFKYGGYYAVYGTSLGATIVGIAYIYFIPESVTTRSTLDDETSSSATSENVGVCGGVVNFISTGNRILVSMLQNFLRS
jgi:hypothetical protein